MNNTNTIAAPETPLLQHIVSPPFLSFQSYFMEKCNICDYFYCFFYLFLLLLYRTMKGDYICEEKISRFRIVWFIDGNRLWTKTNTKIRRWKRSSC